jgi:hypothetical protein
VGRAGTSLTHDAVRRTGAVLSCGIRTLREAGTEQLHAAGPNPRGPLHVPGFVLVVGPAVVTERAQVPRLARRAGIYPDPIVDDLMFGEMVWNTSTFEADHEAERSVTVQAAGHAGHDPTTDRRFGSCLGGAGRIDSRAT